MQRDNEVASKRIRRDSMLLAHTSSAAIMLSHGPRAHLSATTVLLGIAFLAGRWTSLDPLWRRVVIGGATVDLFLGIVLQFGAQSFLLDRELTPGRAFAETVRSYSRHARINFNEKLQHQWSFFGDNFILHQLVVLLLISTVLLVAVAWTARRSAQ